MNKKGQAVFIGGLVGFLAIVLYIILYPVITPFISVALASTNNALAKLFIYIAPFFFLVCIIWGIIAIMRGST